MQADEHPLVSVVVPIYNVEQYLAQCVQSVLDQAHREFELILVDDGSPDASGAMADTWAARDDRVVVIHQENQGLSGARNTGLERARGDYIIFLDSDDFWQGGDALARCVDALRSHPTTDVLIFDSVRFYESTGEKTFRKKVLDRTRMNGASNTQALRYMVEVSDVRPSACTMVVRRRFLLNNNLRFRLGIFSEDIEWFLRLVRCPATYDYLPFSVYMYRQNRAGSITDMIGRANVAHLLDTVTRSSRAVLESDSCDEFKVDFASYCFYQFTIALGFYGGLSRGDRRALNPLVKRGRYLAQYDNYARSREVARLMRLIGLEPTAWVLNKFLRLRAFRRRVR
ncbi:Glycosyltransferase involved in cell wall bisynthesis [Tessaracoccus bendigoensis DSM 12906]|uniref:Glycosyltransferase involved in cell wall bisynthesis n=1 Tax=Tessaracoccus bendigoensis DSM 12906 TaxID=1123357 RepID=A0A1M6K756_9ACTN|nr:glycosyltransferase family 2 protein [Tessaracoccus bendigoensis]SHJ54811.1 Glycosyltransferase involved in cell wall bisynthesis [Tessaracoccus bendigoensis DSM 12906]